MKVWSKTQGDVRDGKFLVVRRDGTIPPWPHFVLGARDPAAPIALRSYADAIERGALGGNSHDPEYVGSIRELARDFETHRLAYGNGDPEAGPHRTDDPAVILAMRHQPSTINVRPGLNKRPCGCRSVGECPHGIFDTDEEEAPAPAPAKQYARDTNMDPRPRYRWENAGCVAPEAYRGPREIDRARLDKIEAGVREHWTLSGDVALDLVLTLKSSGVIQKVGALSLECDRLKEALCRIAARTCTEHCRTKGFPDPCSACIASQALEGGK